MGDTKEKSTSSKLTQESPNLVTYNLDKAARSKSRHSEQVMLINISNNKF